MGSSSSSEQRVRRTSTDSNVLNGSNDFGYEEFGGRGGKTCPTCYGTGRISTRESEELIALIPYSDKRLKPRRTATYVAFAIVACLIICGLILFFILPRSVEITEGGIHNFTVMVDANKSSTRIILTNQFNLTNSNFFHVKVMKVDVEAFYGTVLVGNGKMKVTPLLVSPRTSGTNVDISIQSNFNKENGLSYVYRMCTDTSSGLPHDIYLKFQTTMTSSYLSHSEQDIITSYECINCLNHKLSKK